MEDYSIYDHCCQKSTASESDPYVINNYCYYYYYPLVPVSDACFTFFFHVSRFKKF